jgi:HEPN domain-containing protein
MSGKDTKRLVEHWIESSDRDFKAMNNLFKSKDYAWSLFVGHLVIEKLLKAYYIEINKENPPMIHDLLRIAQKSKLELSFDQENTLDTITKFNIRARYDNYIADFYKLCTVSYTREWIKNIKETRVWLKKILLK